MTESTNTQAQELFKILLLGDNCIDRYMTGVVNRISPEAPVPIFNIEESADVLGMAANVQVNLTRLNCSVFFVTNKEDIVKTRFVDKKSGYQLLRVDHDPKVEPWSENLEEPLDIFDAVVISDYDKGFLTYQHIETLISKFKGPVFIDTKKPDLGRFQGAYVKINETENKNKISVNDKLIVTLGGGGASYNGKVFPTKSAEVTDVCGCGDTFIASLAYQYLLTNDIEKAIMFANVAAGITVQHRGNYAPSYDEIRRAGY
jgi:bifunctional ADP-heptose synthase (sugar kinase/adenylyltransferase)